MKVIIGDNPPVDSEDQGVIFKLSSDEMEKIRSLPKGHDIVVFHPQHWQPQAVKKWSLERASMMKQSAVGVLSMKSEEDAPPAIAKQVAKPNPPEPVQKVVDPRDLQKRTADIINAVKEQEEAVPATQASGGGVAPKVVSDNELLDIIGIKRQETNTSVELGATVSRGGGNG